MSNLISAEQLSTLLNDPSLIILDCRADLADRSHSRELYLESHIPGALFADLETDLSGPIRPGETGRHPLPGPAEFQATLREWGVKHDTRFVVYDQSNGMFAARAWWMLKWAGFSDVRVLNGGFSHWLAKRYPTSELMKLPESTQINIEVRSSMLVNAADILRNTDQATLLDARANERYLGKEEPLDAKAGHIPTAINANFLQNLSDDGRFLTASDLSDRYNKLPDQPVICYCGSGVTACHNILSIAEAGLPMPKLYPGSWSEWILDDSRQIETKPEGML